MTGVIGGLIGIAAAAAVSVGTALTSMSLGGRVLAALVPAEAVVAILVLLLLTGARAALAATGRCNYFLPIGRFRTGPAVTAGSG
jgi:hypothetical protein